MLCALNVSPHAMCPALLLLCRFPAGCVGASAPRPNGGRGDAAVASTPHQDQLQWQVHVPCSDRGVTSQHHAYMPVCCCLFAGIQQLVLLPVSHDLRHIADAVTGTTPNQAHNCLACFLLLSCRFPADCARACLHELSHKQRARLEGWKVVLVTCLMHTLCPTLLLACRF